MTDNQQPILRVCKKCGNTQPIEAFAIVYAKNSRGQNYRQHTCKKCADKAHAELMKKARAKNPDKYKKHQKEHRQRHPDRVRRQRRESGKRLRDSVIAAYGGPVCVCCGETCESMLTIDHINGDGAEHRKLLAKDKSYASGRSGLGDYLYRDLRDRGFPEGFQVLCYNCNISKHRKGVCEHKLKAGSTIIPKGSTVK